MPESKTATQAENPTGPIVLAIPAEEKFVLKDPLNSVNELPQALQEVQKKDFRPSAGNESGPEGFIWISRASARFVKKGRC